MVTKKSVSALFGGAATLDNYLFGAGFATSCAAIGNVVSVELAFESFLEDMVPTPKFWSVKMLVSIAFLQKGVLAILSSAICLSSERVNLIYSTLMVYEVLLISIFCHYAWPAEQPWLHHNDMERRKISRLMSKSGSLVAPSDGSKPLVFTDESGKIDL